MPDMYRSVQVAAGADGAVLAAAGAASVLPRLGDALAAPGSRAPWLAARDLEESAVAPTDAPQPVTASARVTSGTPVRRALQRRLMGCCRTRMDMLLLPAWTTRDCRVLRRRLRHGEPGLLRPSHGTLLSICSPL